VFRATGRPPSPQPARTGSPAGSANLDVNNNQVENVDFRAVHCLLLEQWSGVTRVQ
jgi:hypothetical protein